MSGLNHEFLIINRSIALQGSLSYDVVNSHREAVKTLHDDFFHYFHDTLLWVENTDKRYGFNYYGYTVFSLDEMKKLKSILQAWHDLFLYAPTEFMLTGHWTTIVGVEDSGEYEKILVNKEQLLKSLVDIIGLCEQVEKNPDLVLLHSGI